MEQGATVAEQEMYQALKAWPEVSRKAEDIEKLYGHSPLGLDFEWDVRTSRPTILGLSDGVTNVSVSYDQGKPYLLELLRQYPQTVFIGHNVVGADMMVLEDEGIHLPLEQFEDTILRHWLLNMHLSKAANKAALEEDAGEKRGRGFNNLWTMASLYTPLANWKTCRGEACEGPCPDHDVFGYNGLDSLAPVIAQPQLVKAAVLRDVEKLYPMHRKLAYVLAQMSRKGVYVDMPYVRQLRADFQRDKTELGESFPFNPKSGKQIKEYFGARGIVLEDTQEATIRETVEGPPDDVDQETLDQLDSLLEYKELGEGPDRWFAPRIWDSKKNEWTGFVDENDYVHCHLGFFTSSARMMCSGPNLQNVAKRRVDRRKCICGHRVDEHVKGVGCVRCGEACKAFQGENVGKRIRRAVIAPPGHYIARADFSNGENRVYIYMAGYEAPKTDLHNWMVDLIGLKPEDEFSVRMGSPRDASKSVTHATDYGEGLQLVTARQLHSPRMQQEIKAGARIVIPEWTFQGKTATFTGVNLARRAWGSATYENRRRALEVRQKYLKTFPGILELQKRITKQTEQYGVVRPPNGYALLSYGFPEDRIKTALAVWGSQPIAHLSKLALLSLWDAYENGRPMWPVLQIHDEIITYVEDSVPPEQAVAWIREAMEVETAEMPGFVCPADGSFGPNWKDQTKVKK